MSPVISVFDIERAKAFAKQSKSSFPNLSHAKRLDYAAQQLFKARNYHELNAWREATIQEHVIAEPYISRCTYCGTNFVAGQKEEQKFHRERHDSFEEASTVFGYVPEQHSQRERRKKSGYDLVINGDNIQKQLEGALDVLRGWFDRSVCRAIREGYWKQHPKFDVYVSYMVGSLSNIHFPDNIRSELEATFGRLDGFMDKSDSDWYPV